MIFGIVAIAFSVLSVFAMISVSLVCVVVASNVVRFGGGQQNNRYSTYGYFKSFCNMRSNEKTMPAIRDCGVQQDLLKQKGGLFVPANDA